MLLNRRHCPKSRPRSQNVACCLLAALHLHFTLSIVRSFSAAVREPILKKVAEEGRRQIAPHGLTDHARDTSACPLARARWLLQQQQQPSVGRSVDKRRLSLSCRTPLELLAEGVRGLTDWGGGRERGIHNAATVASKASRFTYTTRLESRLEPSFLLVTD